MNILVIEDEKNLALALVHILEHAGYSATAELTGTSGLKRALSENFDAIILDRMLPELDGMELLHDYRLQKPDTPVLMLTARSATIDKVEGLDAGADDYMTKPFETDELLARLRALTRRNLQDDTDMLHFGDISLVCSTHELSCTTRSVRLSTKEYEVMFALLQAAPQLISKPDLHQRVWQNSDDSSQNSVEAYVSFLRKKLNYLHSGVHIATLRMLGYRLEYESSYMREA